MNRLSILLALGVLSTGTLQAQKPAAAPVAAPTPAPAAAPAPAPAGPPAPATPRETKITNRSFFDPEGPTTRNPFLPIGYVRPVQEAPREMVLDVRPEMFSITAILLGDPPLAIINGKDRGVGDRIPLNASGTEFVLVRRISDGEVVMEYRGRAIVVPAGRRR
jgi:hypothetical protein